MLIKPGKTVSHYRILEKLGSGGMGVVYKAQDLKLERFTALKFLSPLVEISQEDKDRFIQEARTTSALDHPNICTIYEIDETETGQLFIAMAFYEGETLKEIIDQGPLSVKSALDYTVQLAEGLAKAHAKGVVHRDIKPANLIITEDGILKILDFGVAKLQHQSRPTSPGALIGTPAYMAPEQILGEQIDHRIDIWATGVILFEMLTGQLPFKGDSDPALMYSIVNEPPLPISDYRPNVPEALQQILSRLLANRRDDRYPTMNELLEDLASFRQAVPTKNETRVLELTIPQEPSVAVLPFSDLSPNQDQEYFCEGLSEEIMNTLSRIEGLKVASRNSTFQFKGQNLDVGQIGRQLKVSTVLEGSLRKGGDKIRVSIRLVNVADGFLLWAQEFERKLEDIFAIQDEISQKVAQTLKGKLVDKTEAPAIQHGTRDVAAYNAYLKGRYYWNKRTGDALTRSIDYFLEAIDLDAQYARAHAGLADAYTVLGLYGMKAPASVFPRAKQAARQALQLDEGLAEAHTSLACIHAVFDWKWERAEAHFRRAIELNPDYALAHHWYAINLLAPLSRFDEALKEIMRALEIEPISLVYNTTLGLVYYFSHQYHTAISYYLKTLEMDPNFAITHFFLGNAYAQTSRYPEAMHHLRQALNSYGESTNMLASIAHTASRAGNSEIAEKVLEKLMSVKGKVYVSAYDIATIYAGMGKISQALEWLKNACEEHSYLMIYLKVDPMLNPLRNEPEFKNLENTLFQLEG